MLNFLKIEHSSLSEMNIWNEIRLLIIKGLNKGQIISWQDCLLELCPGDDKSLISEYEQKFKNLTTHEFLKNILDFSCFEYYFHSSENVQIFEKNFNKRNIQIPIDHEDWQLWLDIIATNFNQNWNIENPFVSFYSDFFGKKFRISLIHQSTSPLSISKMFVRPIQSEGYSLENYGHETWIKELINNKSNIIIGGSTGSGKTSLLSAMLNHINKNEHLIILEDTFEIQTQHLNQTRFLSREEQKTSLKYYLSCALRLTPDRLIIGEMRSQEAIPFILAMNAGIKGLMSTIHCNSAAEAIERLALIFCLYQSDVGIDYSSIMKLITKSVDYVVYIENKRIKEIIKVLGSDGGTPFFEHLI